MAKGTGLIGNFRGKVGNMVGYNLKDSNNKQTQGVRVYQPIVKNPKSAGQAEQRAKLLAVNATYRALKMVIDRGNEGLPYGNKSRLAWLKTALKADGMPWIEKGKVANFPVICPLTKGSLPTLGVTVANKELALDCVGVQTSSDVSTIGKLSTLIKAGYPTIQDGDQVTFVSVTNGNNAIIVEVESIVIDPTSNVETSIVEASQSKLVFQSNFDSKMGTVILSRMGEGGEHLRSNSILTSDAATLAAAPYDADSKAAAIASYRASDAVSSDWAEESVQ